MRRLKTVKIQGNEVLAKDIYSDSGVIVIAEGTKLKIEYKKKLLDMHISEVFVEDEISKEIRHEDYTDEVICKQCSETLKNTIECFAYASDNEMQKLIMVADGVMQSVLSNKEVLYNVSLVRRSDQSLSDHCLSVAALSILTGLHAGFSIEETKEIAIGALLHDIGFLNIKVNLKGVMLDEAEPNLKTEIKKHVVYGYMNVEKQSWLSNTAKNIILYHHERVDGTGYPFGLIGDRITPAVKLVAICDAFDNMIYGNLEPRKKVYEAMEYIMGMAGIKYDRDYAIVFNNSVAAYPVGTLVITNTDETCIVVRQNNSAPTRPIIKKVIKSKDSEWSPTGVEYDLIKDLTLFIVDTID